MRSRALALAFGLLICLTTMSTAVVTAQERAPRQLIVSLSEGGFVAFKSETAWTDRVKQASKPTAAQGALEAKALVDEGHIIHRVLLDAQGNVVFGYDLFVEPQPGKKQFRIAISPLDERFAEKLLAGSQRALTQRQPSLKAPARISTLPQSAEPQILDDGDSFSLDLLVNQNTGVKIVDIVKVTFDRSTLWDTNPQSLPRDFTLDAVEMAVHDYRLLINGEVVVMRQPVSNPSGALLWFYVTDRGRFIFSLVPREGYGFQKVGIIEDNRIEFTIKGDHYEWISSAPVLPGGGTWNLWVLHDPRYTPPVNDFAAYPQKDRDKRSQIDLTADKIWNRASQIVTEQKATATSLDEKSHPEPAKPVQLIPKRIRVITGGADRVENLWPKQQSP